MAGWHSLRPQPLGNPQQSLQAKGAAIHSSLAWTTRVQGPQGYDINHSELLPSVRPEATSQGFE